jgi:hypothetical protein
MNGAATTMMPATIATRRNEIHLVLVPENDAFHEAARGAIKSNSAGAPPEARCHRVSNTRTTDFVSRLPLSPRQTRRVADIEFRTSLSLKLQF